MAAPFFDFHFHPVFKQFICEFSLTPTRLVDDLLGPLEFESQVLTDIDSEFLHILGSQSCLEQMQEGSLMLGVAALCPIEKMFTSRESLFGKILNSKLTRPLDEKMMTAIRDRQVSYHGLLLRELALYKQLRDADKIELLSRKNPRVAGSSSVVPRLALSLEGGHSLCQTLIGQPSVLDKTLKELKAILPDGFSPIIDPAQSLQNLQAALWNHNMDLCYLVLTHLSHIEQQWLATHAYGLKMLKDDTAYPVTAGISALGFEVIRAAYTLQVNGTPAPVIIDLKHMSLKSRLDLYRFRAENPAFQKIPLICSHAGVTGYSIEAWQHALDTAQRMKLDGGETVVELTIRRKTAGFWGKIGAEFTYNAWSINLMDEDILAILQSKGMIGVSLDVRILGWQDFFHKGDKEEFMSMGEFRHFFPDAATQLASQPLESELVPTRQERHPLAFCFNLLHIISVGKTGGITNPWEQVCIGSDYDGLINPVINCRNAGQLPALETALLRWLPVAEQAYRAENGGPALLKRATSGEVDQVALTTTIRNVMYNNGQRFLIAIGF